jgi:ArsR family transcriptional regulator
MNRKMHDKFEARARIFKALAHPTRLFIVNELSRQECCVCELTGMIEADTSTVSRHLSILYQAGIVDYEKRGLQVWYRLRMPCVVGFFSCIESVLKANAAKQTKVSV